VYLLPSIFFLSTWILALAANTLTALPRVQVDGDDEAVETQHLGENKNENHSHKETRLLSGSPYARVSNDADGVAGGKTRKTDGQACTEVNKAPKKWHLSDLTALREPTISIAYLYSEYFGDPSSSPAIRTDTTRP
jgi:hypothetical protein